MAQEIKRLLQREDKGLSQADNVPAALLRVTFLDLDITLRKWDEAIRNYVTSPKSGVAPDPSKRSQERSNTNRAVAADRITWRTFTKAIHILGPKGQYYELRLYWDPDLRLPNLPPAIIRYKPISRQNELHAMVSKLYSDLGITPQTWQRLVDKYLDRTVGDNSVERSNERGNLKKAIIDRNQYPWDIFIKALDIIGVLEVHFTVYLNWGRMTTHHSHHFRVRDQVTDIE